MNRFDRPHDEAEICHSLLHHSHLGCQYCVGPNQQPHRHLQHRPKRCEVAAKESSKATDVTVNQTRKATAEVLA